MSVESFPVYSQELEPDKPEFAPVRNASTRKAPAWFNEARKSEDGLQPTNHNVYSSGIDLRRNQSTRSTRTYRSTRSIRDSDVDLNMLVSDLDFYAGAVHDYDDYDDEEEWYEDEDYDEEYEDDSQLGSGDWPLPQGGDGSTYGGISIVRNKSGKSLKRGLSTRSRRSEKDVNLVTWEGPDDPENPKNWTRKRKWMATAVVSLFTFISPVSSSMIAPGLTQLQAEFNIQSPSQVAISLSVFILAFAVGPLFIGPLSELVGRSVVLQTCNIFYLAFNLACGFSKSSGQLIAFRFLSGLGGSAPLGIGGGILGDLWMPQERGKAMAVYSLMPLLGPAIGPIAGGFIAQRTTWRWVFYATSIAAGLIGFVGFFTLRETYAAEILRRKKVKLIKLTGNKELHTEFETPNRKLSKHMRTAFERPFRMLFTQPIVQILALYIGYVYGVMYLVLASFPVLWEQVYGESIEIGGLNYISLGLGFWIGTQIAAKSADRIYKGLKAKHNGIAQSEFRVPLMIPGAILVPVGLVIYGWAAQKRTHWIVPNIGTAIFAAGNQMVFQCCQTYIVDAYTRFAASAIAATTVLRSLGGFAFPLFAQAMYNALGYGWGNSILALAGVVIGFPMPVLLWFYGAELRKKSQFAAG